MLGYRGLVGRELGEFGVVGGLSLFYVLHGVVRLFPKSSNAKLWLLGQKPKL